MKIKDIVNIINLNQNFSEQIVKYHENLSKLNYLDVNGEFTEFAKKYMDTGGIVEPALIDYDKKIISYNKPRLDKVLKEYKEWLETEI